MFKRIITQLLELQARRLLKKHKPKVIAITGSVGKTSTREFIVTVLRQKYRVLTPPGNYNTHLSVPLSLFELPMPQNLKDPVSWLDALKRTQRTLKQPFNYDVVVLELGAEYPGDVPQFRSYLYPDIAVVTAVSPEHMLYFKTLDAVAQEELSIASFSKLTLVNRDDIDAGFAKYADTTSIDTYGTSGVAEYRFITEDYMPGKGFSGKFISPEQGEQPARLLLAGEHNIRCAVAAGAVGIKLGLTPAQITAGFQQIVPIKGRMQLLRGLNDTVLLDDTYNASPKSVLAALQTLYAFPAKQKIAILGSMNDMGDMSKQVHEEVGKACDGSLVEWVVTIGDEAKKYLAPAAASRGCQVRSFTSPYQAGAFVHSVMQPGAVILAKGSQNGIFAEEALKVLLHATVEENLLVRQSPAWLEVKAGQFDMFPVDGPGSAPGPKPKRVTSPGADSAPRKK